MHIDNHLKILSKEWSGATTCQWPKCTSKSLFKTAKQLADHTLNVHVKPLLCPVPSCSHKKPFGRESDLLRHHKTKHGNGQKHKCPVQDCDANATGFSRKDKMLQHIREKHALLKCGYNHCSAKVLETETESHLREFHGNLECAIGGCKNARKSCFGAGNLFRHLRTSHSIGWGPAYTILRIARFSEDKTARCELRESWRACKSCSTQ